MTKKHPQFTGAHRDSVHRATLDPGESFLRLADVQRAVGLSRSAIYERIANGSFPSPIPLDGRAVGWLSSDVRRWMTGLIEAVRSSPDAAACRAAKVMP